MAERYRDLQRPSMLETGIVQQNAGSAAARLADVFTQFEQQANAFGGELRTQKGQEQGALAGEQKADGSMPKDEPLMKSGLRTLTNYGKAFDNAALRSYTIRAEADAQETAARLEVEAANDPDKFGAKFGAVRDEVLKNAEPGLRAALSEVYQRHLGAGVARLQTARSLEVRAEQRATTAEGIARSVDSIGQLRASDDPASFVQAEEEDLKLNLLIDGAVNDGTLSVTEGQALKVDAFRSVVKSTVVARFAREFDSPYGDPVGFIERLREANKTSEALPPAEEAKLQDDLLAELRERNAMRSAKVSAQDGARQLRYLEGDRTATAALLSGSLSQRQLLKMVEADTLDPSDARTLLNQLHSGDPGNSDPRELFSVETNLLSESEEDIRSNEDLSWSDRSRLLLKRREEAAGWKGSQQAKEGADRIDRALGIAPGVMRKALDPEEAKQRESALTEWYNAVDALPEDERQTKAIEIAEQVTQRVIKTNARNEVEQIRGRVESIRARYGDLEKLSTKNRATYDAEMKLQQDRLREAEQRAK